MTIKKSWWFIFAVICLIITCTFSYKVLTGRLFYYSDDEITRLLNSNNPKELVIGAFEAGESGNKKFIPLLTKNAGDARVTHLLQFKGFSVYQEKMVALKKILEVSPKTKITFIPDSTVIRFYAAKAAAYKEQ